MVKNLPAMQETWVQSLVREDPLEKGMATHSSLLAQRIPMGYSPQGCRVRHDWATKHSTSTLFPKKEHRMLLFNRIFRLQEEPTPHPHPHEQGTTREWPTRLNKTGSQSHLWLSCSKYSQFQDSHAFFETNLSDTKLQTVVLVQQSHVPGDLVDPRTGDGQEARPPHRLPPSFATTSPLLKPRPMPPPRPGLLQPKET